MGPYIVEARTGLMYRFLRSEARLPIEFTARHAKGLRRIPRSEDAVTFRGISTYADPEFAIEKAIRANEAALGRQPFRFIGAINLDPDRGDRCAKTLGEGHWTVWGDPGELASSSDEVFPIPGY